MSAKDQGHVDEDQTVLDHDDPPHPPNSSSNPSRRRTRQTLPRSASHHPLIGMINAAILAIGLTVILASRCDEPTTTSDQSGWLDSLITPKDLHLPKSVTDVLRDREENTPLDKGASERALDPESK